MDEEVTAPFWISFFVEAGIPPAAAANYAIIFTENRIQKHMLLDLTKEYLKDMGITVLGDVIAILKHSKRYHEKVAREKVLAIDKETSVMKATKHLNEMLLKDDIPKSVVNNVKISVPKINTVTRPSPPKKLKTAKPEVLKDTEEIEWVEEVEEFEELKRKVIPPKLPTKKATPVVNPTKVVKKTSVFDRLGESNVTSTTPEIQDSPINATAASKTQPSSVFRRLGGIQEKKESPMDVKAVTRTLISTLPVKTVKKVATKPSEASDSTKSFLRMDIENSAIKQSARERLGLDRPSSTKISVVSTKVAPKNPIRTIVSPKSSEILFQTGDPTKTACQAASIILVIN
ncbi:hypothetical protein DAPPUDRAFT_262091 [Daphnia pulex]|uniref:DUF5577 domain-containing protein n=1 Tax=Daphnia pulex TaxID=6669 RepID=E9HMB8_DAPPU|nr:hypothetical protein DAPPUDRAFT_262091 [Daphnia pulex]|eukprot:EFX67131.1 hypothetical protein DAPPUDRAFT_262091 [Daphnia pulex]